MFGELGVPELLVILGIALLLFGPKKIGELGKSLGEGIRGFKSAIRGEEEKPSVTTATASPATTVVTEEAPKPTPVS
jgi:sec-independent protein translocase protein TatA